MWEPDSEVPEVFRPVMAPIPADELDLEAYEASQTLIGEAMDTEGEERLNNLANAIRKLTEAYPDPGGMPRGFLERSYTDRDAFDAEEIDNALNRLVARGQIEPVVREWFLVPDVDDE